MPWFLLLVYFHLTSVQAGKPTAAENNKFIKAQQDVLEKNILEVIRIINKMLQAEITRFTEKQELIIEANEKLKTAESMVIKANQEAVSAEDRVVQQASAVRRVHP